MSYTSKESLQTMDKPKFLWTRSKIYAAIMSKVKRATKQRVDLDKTVAQMLYEADIVDVLFGTDGKTSANLIKQLHSIESAFDIQIYASYTLRDVASVAEWWLEKQGRFEESVDSQIDAIAKAKPTPKARSK